MSVETVKIPPVHHKEKVGVNKPKVLLINPPTPFLGIQNAAPHLGLGGLVSYLRFKGIGADYVNYETDDPKDIVLPEGYDYYGFTAVTPQYYYANLLKSQVDKRGLGQTVIGGAHASIRPEECIKDGFSYVVRGYGEQALFGIVSGHCNPGIIQGVAVDNIDELPMPAWDQLFKSDYNFSFGDKTAHIFTARGCPFNCFYCCSPTIYGTKVAERDITKVMDEIRFLKRHYNVNSLYFFDPTFTLSKVRAMALADQLKGFDINWTCQTRVDRVDPELLTSLKQAGCSQISFGIEAGDAGVHGNLGKRTSVDQNALAIKMAHDAGMKVKAFLMGALPDDTWKTADTFKEFIIRNRPDSWLYSTFIPFPGTDYWNNPQKHGIEIVVFDSRAYYPLGLNARGPVNIKTPNMSRDELVALRNDMLDFLRNEVPNPRVEETIRMFPEQKKRVEPYFAGLDTKYIW